MTLLGRHAKKRRALMARTPRPWYFSERKAYAANVKGKRVILLKGDETPANARRAAKKLRQVLKGTEREPQGGRLRVADIIDRYLALHREKYSEQAFAIRKHYLQLFAEAHGWGT